MRCYNSQRSEFAILYGRRRIGKTFLVNKTFEGKFTFRFIGSHKAPKERQLERFALNLKEQGNLSYLPKVDSWYHAFDALQEMIKQSKAKGKKVIFFDEMPWIDTYASEFVSALEDFWNTWAALRDDILFVACGSATSWMVDKIVENQGGLHGRITSRIYLKPFTLAETEEYLRQEGCVWNRYTIAQCYMYVGGTPYYLSLLEPKKDLPQNIDELFFTPQAKLKGEIAELFNVLFKDAERYIEIVRALVEHREGLTRKQISDITKSNGGTLTSRLENLERCDFIMGQQQYGKKKKGIIYRIADFFTLFYFSFVEGTRPPITPYWQKKINSNAVKIWQGLTFELLVNTHVDKVIQHLGISGILTTVSAWRSERTSNMNKQRGRKDIMADNPQKESSNRQIDLIIAREDPYIYLCEMKFSQEEYTITKEYEQKLRQRMSLFREQTKTRAALLTTFITTYGVNPNIHSDIVQYEITLDQLFEKTIANIP